MKKVAKNVYYHTTTDGINVGLVVGDDAVACIDLPIDPLEADEWRKEIRDFAGKPIRAVIFTSSERLNSESIAIVGAPVIIHDQAFAQVATPLEPLPAMPLEPPAPMPASLRDLLSTPHWTFSEAASVALSGGKQRIFVDAVYRGGCAPEGSFVILRGQGILFAGEHVTVGYPPLLAQGDWARWQEVLQELKQDSSVSLIVPGRGAPTAPGPAVDGTLEYIREALALVRSMVRAGKPRSELASLVPDLMAKYGPRPGKGNKLTLDLDMIGRQVRAGLETIYDSIKSGTLK